MAYNHKRNGSYIRLLRGKTGLVIGFCTGAAIAQHHRLSGLNNKHFFLSFAGWDLQDQGEGFQVLLAESSLGGRGWSLFHMGTNSIQEGSTLMI